MKYLFGYHRTAKECQKLDWDCHKKECCMNPNERDKAAGTCHHDSSKSKKRPDEDTINISSKKFAAKDDDDDDVEEVYTDFKGHNAHSDDVNIMEDNKLEKEHLLLQKEVQKLALALEKKDAKLSKVKEKQIDLLLENEGLKTIIKQEDARKPSPEELLSCQVCAEEYTYHVDSSEGFNRNLPVQSQVCEHVICYGCVCRMQQALLETRNVVKWIKCPMCNTKHAFNAEKPIISRVNVEWIRSQKKREDSSSNNAITTVSPKNDTPDNTAIGSNDANQSL
jgi:HRD ubiquitin ligase complex, ER membrane component